MSIEAPFLEKVRGASLFRRPTDVGSYCKIEISAGCKYIGSWALVRPEFFYDDLMAFGCQLQLSKIWYVYLFVFLAAQIGRVWVILSLNGRWSTRIIVLPGKELVHVGPYKYLSHPNYWIVAIEFLTMPLIFNLYVSAAIFTMLNAYILLTVRLPAEEFALLWAQRQRAPRQL